MTERERLIELLRHSIVPEYMVQPLAKYLVENGVVMAARCSECKNAEVAYCRDHKTISRTEIYCIRDENRHGKQWYCADGERREDNEGTEHL